LNPEVIDACQEQELPILSGAFSPTEIATAWELGSCAVKVFPANVLGPGYIKDVLAPMPELCLLPTGGISLENIDDYFCAGATAVGVGGSLLDRAALKCGDWKAISELASAYAEKCQANNTLFHRNS
jgi:2-dehydro-3-deoxyphosphogluconate aldolase/(4S)-4-hydroxy-2-oxoglutarate aldolase